MDKTNAYKLEYLHSSRANTRSQLVITMPTNIHDVLKCFAYSIKEQLFRADENGVSFTPIYWQSQRLVHTVGSTSKFNIYFLYPNYLMYG